MKTLLMIAMLALSACGSAPTKGNTEPDTVETPTPVVTPVPSSTPTATRTFSVSLTGDGVTFTLALFSDAQQISLAPTTLAAGQTLTYSVVGSQMSNSGITRVSGVDVANGGAWLTATVFVDGVQVEAQQLSTQGTSTNFSDR
jgi:type IV pilus biogenesis protein CpaD/CtpE